MPLPKADLVLRGGPVWCGLATGTREALAVWAGWVLATDTTDEIEPLIGPGTQPVFMHDFGELYALNPGEERAYRAYPMRLGGESGLMPAASTDAPVCDIDPFANLDAMITRRTAGGTVMGGQERLTLPEALSAYSLNGAHAEFAERRKGTLEPGKLADIAGLSRDIPGRPGGGPRRYGL